MLAKVCACCRHRITLAVLRMCDDPRERWRAGNGGHGQQPRGEEEVAPVERKPACHKGVRCRAGLKAPA